MITEATQTFITLKIEALYKMGVIIMPTDKLWAYLEVVERDINPEDIYPLLKRLGIVGKDGFCHLQLTEAEIQLLDAMTTPLLPPAPTLSAS